jgi:hypothetical protein
MGLLVALGVLLVIGKSCGDDTSIPRTDLYRAASTPYGYRDTTPSAAPSASEQVPATEHRRYHSSQHRRRIPRSEHYYIRGPRGGCYYINSHGNKVYVDRSLCN